MNLSDYLLEQEGQDWSAYLADWHWLLPSSEFTLWIVNRYGDLFLVPDDGTVQILDVGAGTLKQVAGSREEFLEKMDDAQNANNWLMIPLVDACVATGMTLAPGRCYSYRTLPVFGGKYTVENTVTLPIAEHFGVLARIHQKIKAFPDGTQVRLVVR